MDSFKLQDRLHYGAGVAARHAGNQTDAFRPDGQSNPLCPSNRFLRLPAVFTAIDGGTTRPVSYGKVEWVGIFDASYTQPGDYLVQKQRTFFIAAQQPLLPVLCIQTNRVISITRPSVQTNTAANPYGGYTTNGNSVLVNAWPASVLGVVGRGEPAADLPTDQTTPYLEILLPGVACIPLAAGDLISDDLGRSAVIGASELTALGWRITAKMATT